MTGEKDNVIDLGAYRRQATADAAKELAEQQNQPIAEGVEVVEARGVIRDVIDGDDFNEAGLASARFFDFIEDCRQNGIPPEAIDRYQELTAKFTAGDIAPPTNEKLVTILIERNLRSLAFEILKLDDATILADPIRAKAVWAAFRWKCTEAKLSFYKKYAENHPNEP